MGVIRLPVAQGVMVKVQIENDENDDGLRMLLELLLTGETIAQFENDQVRIAALSSGEEWIAEAKAFDNYIRNGVLIPSTETVSADRILPTEFSHLTEEFKSAQSSAWIDTSFQANYFPEEGQIFMPSLIVDGRAYEVPSAKFKRYDDEVKQYAYETEMIRVANLSIDIDLFTGAGSLEKSIWSIRASRNKDRGSQLVARIDFSLENEWRFSSDQILIHDEQTAEKRWLEFEDIYTLTRQVEVGFTSPIINQRFVERTEFQKALKIADREYDELTIQLPSIIVNGNRVKLKPIVFKKSSAVVVLPFNC
jgi:hypothetical protein